MEMLIRPYEGMGPVSFDMSAAEVTYLLGNPDSQLRPGRFSYDTLGLYVDFDEHDRVKFIECASPSVATFGGIQLAGNCHDARSKLAAAKYLLEQGDAKHGDLESTYCVQLGLVLWCPDEDIESVAVWRQGFWDAFPDWPLSSRATGSDES